MKLPSHFLLLSLLFTFSQGNSKVFNQEKEIITNPKNGHQYFITEKKRSWQEAQKLAETKGGYLVIIEDEQENTWLTTTFLETNNEIDFLWIGLNDVEKEGEFVWVNGDKLTYQNWAKGEPNNNPNQGGEHWAVLNGFANPFQRVIGSWSDAPEKAKLRAIIEIPSKKAKYKGQGGKV